MRVSEAKTILEAIASGAPLTDASIHAQLDALAANDLVHVVADRDDEVARLDALKERLRAAPTEADRRALRSEVLALSEALAMSRGGTRVPAGGGGTYRDGGASDRRVVLTQRGRAFLSDVEPRVERASDLEVSVFEDEMELFRRTIERRAIRAANLAAQLRTRFSWTWSGAWRSTAIGLATLREDESTILDVFGSLLDAVGARASPWSPERVVSAMECICLAAPRLADIDPATWTKAILDERDRLLQAECQGDPAASLGVSVVLAGLPRERWTESLARADSLRRSVSGLGLAPALVCVSTGLEDFASLATTLDRGADALKNQGHAPGVAADAVALALATHLPPDDALERILAHREHLARHVGDPPLASAALLAWLEAPVSETLDDLRLAAAVVQTFALGMDAGEISANAVKLVLLSALLAEGSEGDAEEKLALGARMRARLAGVGGGTVAIATPLLMGVTTSFVQPMLDAAAVWDASHRQTQGYVHAGGHYHHYG